MLRSLPRILVSGAATIAFATGLTAQCQTVETPSSIFGNWVPGAMFDVANTSTQPLRVTDLHQVFVSAATSPVEIWTRAGAWQGFENSSTGWTQIGTASVAHGAFVMTALPIPIGVTIAPGAVQAFCVMSPSQDVADGQLGMLGQNQLGTTIAGDGSLEIRCGIAKISGFDISWGQPTHGFLWRGRVDYCRVATNETIGAGCGAVFDSFYQSFPNGAVASPVLTGNVLHLHPTAHGYTGTWSAGTASALYATPPAGGTQLTTGDDSWLTITPSTPLPTPYGPRSTLAASINGILAFGSSAPGDYTPTPAEFLQHVPGGIYAWHDYVLASGRVCAHESGQTLFVTWQGVADLISVFAGPIALSTMQFQLNLATGDVAMVFVGIENTVFASHLIGVSAPGASADPGSVNLGTTTLVTASPESAALSLTALSTPVTNTNWHLRTGNLPSITAFGITVVGLSDPGVDDLAVIGMPNCGLRASLDILGAFLPSPGATQHDWSLFVPDDVTLLGVPVHATTIVATNPATNAFGLVTTNGIRGTIATL